MTTRKLRILIVEDEAPIREGLVDVFVFHGYDCTSTDNGRDGLKLAATGQFDMLILDVMLPGLNGYEICESVRKNDRDQPIIMLTAKTADEDIIRGLKLGADDYVAKPFSIAQLVVRVEAVLRRAKVVTSAQARINLTGVVIDTLNLTGTRGSEVLNFTRREMDILEFMFAHRDRPVSREELLTKVWGYARDLDIETRTVDIHIAKLRRKLELDPKRPTHLVTVRGAGYRLMAGQGD